MIVLVTGDRAWTDSKFIFDTLDKERAIYRSELEWNLLVHGDCRGADRIAGEWAVSRGIHECKVPALWTYHFKAAGPIRNSIMLYLQPSLVIAFHPDLANSKGTADMVGKSRKKNIPVQVYNGRPGSETQTQPETKA